METERSVGRASELAPDVLEGLAAISVGDIGHVRQFGFMDVAIRPVWRDVRLIGRAVTVRMPGMDIDLNREVVRRAGAGDVIVVDRGGDTQTACWGGFAALLAKAKGVAGLVVDGAVTDTMELTEMRWPVYSRGVSGLVGRRLGGHGEVGTVISCGGVPVAPGDLVIGDDDGLVVVPVEDAPDLLARCRERFGRTPDIREWLRSGKAIGDYPGVADFLSS